MADPTQLWPRALVRLSQSRPKPARGRLHALKAPCNLLINPSLTPNRFLDGNTLLTSEIRNQPDSWQKASDRVFWFDARKSHFCCLRLRRKGPSHIARADAVNRAFCSHCDVQTSRTAKIAALHTKYGTVRFEQPARTPENRHWRSYLIAHAGRETCKCTALFQYLPFWARDVTT